MVTAAQSIAGNKSLRTSYTPYMSGWRKFGRAQPGNCAERIPFRPVFRSYLEITLRFSPAGTSRRGRFATKSAPAGRYQS